MGKIDAKNDGKKFYNQYHNRFSKSNAKILAEDMCRSVYVKKGNSMVAECYKGIKEAEEAEKEEKK